MSISGYPWCLFVPRFDFVLLINQPSACLGSEAPPLLATDPSEKSISKDEWTSPCMRSCRKGPAPSLETIAYTERESPPELHIWSSLQHNRAPNSSNNLQQAALIPRAFPSNPGPLSKTLRNWKWYHRNRQLLCEIHTGLEEKQERGKTGISGVSERTKKKKKNGKT